MANDPTEFIPITGYVCRKLKARAGRISAHNQRYSLSRLVEESLEAYLPTIEAKLGITNKPARKAKEAV